VRYIEFLAAGALCMSAMMTASFEALYSAFSRMHVQRTWESIMNAPLTLDDVLRAEWLWAATKSLISAVAIVLVVLALGISRAPTLPLVIPVALLTGLCFAALGLCFNALARGYDFFSYYFTLVLTPMMFVSGVYYPQDTLPTWLKAIAQWLPLSAAVELARPLMLGEWPPRVALPLALLLAYATGGWFLARTLTRRRFRT
jgi:lipooligosaccharide transport system permease protein